MTAYISNLVEAAQSNDVWAKVTVGREQIAVHSSNIAEVHNHPPTIVFAAESAVSGALQVGKPVLSKTTEQIGEHAVETQQGHKALLPVGRVVPDGDEYDNTDPRAFQ